jgi:hypothetical protein
MPVSAPRLLGLAAILLAAAPALARADPVPAPDAPVAAAFGNTVVTTYPDGRTQQIWLAPDGRWSGISRTRKELAGKWTLKGDKLCMRQQTPPTLPFSYCTAFPQDAHVGAAWTSKDFVGTPIQLKLVRGVQTASVAN